MVLTIEDQSDKTNENDRFIVLQDSREQRNASEATVTLVSVPCRTVYVVSNAVIEERRQREQRDIDCVESH